MNPISRLFGYAFIWALPALMMFRSFWFRRTVLRLVLRHEITGLKFVEICQAFAVINRSCSEHKFVVKRAGNFQFRENSLILIWGCIGSQGVANENSAGWVSSPALLAIADAEHADWTKDYPEVFSPLFLGPRYLLYGVNLSALRTQMRHDSISTGAN
jgi:hypothetical protein